MSKQIMNESSYVGKISALKGLMVEIIILHASPEERELLVVEGLDNVHLDNSTLFLILATCVDAKLSKTPVKSSTVSISLESF